MGMSPAHRESLATGQRIGARYALSAPARVPLGLSGAQLANRAGSSLEFMDHRAYQPGDDLRRIDWSAFARSDRLTVKLFREEVNPHADILIDGSRSMDLAGTAKSAATLALAAAFAVAAGNAGFTHCAWIGRNGWQRVPNGAADPVEWEGIEFDDRRSPADSLAASAGLWRPRSIRVLLSDLLWLGEPMVVLGPLAAQAASVVVVQVLAEADMHPPQRGNVRLTDSETDEQMEVFVDAVAQRRYRQAVAHHQQNWHRATRKAGAVLTTVTGESFLRDGSLDDLLAAGVLKVT